MKIIRAAYIIGLLLLSLTVNAKIHLPQILSDGMMFQRDMPITVWGYADAGETVKISFLKKNYQTKADKAGRWTIQIPPQVYGGPYEMKINGESINNILIGDVFLCSGQSNMELPIRRVTDLFAEEANRDSCAEIRYIKVPLSYDFHKCQSDIKPSNWESLNARSAQNFSAVCYFFAKARYARTGVPVGIINSSVGGSPIESWLSEESQQAFPEYAADLRMCQDDAFVSAEKAIINERNRVWYKTLYSTPLSTKAWTPMSLFSAAWAIDGLHPVYGLHLFRKTFSLTKEQIKSEAVLRLGCIVDADSVFVNGKFVGTTAYQYPPRIYKVPSAFLKEGENTIEIHLVSYGSRPCFVPDKPYMLITSSGTVSLREGWLYRLGVQMPAMRGGETFHYKPTGLYNGMIAPLSNLRFAGVIWYQGESNVSGHDQYCDQLLTLMKDWRALFGEPDLRFAIVELAGFLHPQSGDQTSWAALRIAQHLATEKDKNAVLVPNADLGEWNDIHPLDKKTVGMRINHVFE